MPADWASGIYVARFVEDGASSLTGGGEPTGSGTADGFDQEPFVVKPRNPGVSTPILYKWATLTRHAYNLACSRTERGSSLYQHPVYEDDPSSCPRPGHRVSMHRPTGAADLGRWDVPMITWLESNGYTVEYCTDLDWHEDPKLGQRYALVLSVGHDEYWTEDMRRSAESLVRRGGNIAFLGANTCWCGPTHGTTPPSSPTQTTQ